jgi:hypothetical protein
MAWVGVAIAAASAASSIMGLRRGSGGLAEALQAIHVSLDAILKNQVLIGDSIVAISVSIESLHKSVLEIPSTVLDKIAHSEVHTAAELLFSKLQLLRDFPNETELHAQVVQHFQDLHAASIRLSYAFADGRPTIHAFRPSTLAMSAAFTACLLLKSINKLPPYFPQLYGQIRGSTIDILTGINDPERGLPALIDQAVSLIREKSLEIAKLESLFKDPLLWARHDSLIDLATAANTAVTEIPGASLDPESAGIYFLAQAVKTRTPDATKALIVNKRYDVPMGGSESSGEGYSVRGYEIFRFTENVFQFELKSRLKILAERFLTIEFRDAAFTDLDEIGTYHWDYREDYDNGRRSGVVATSDPKVIEFLDAAGGSHTARKISESKFREELNQYRDMLEIRNNVAALAAQYEAIRTELVELLSDYSNFRSLPDEPVRTFG